MKNNYYLTVLLLIIPIISFSQMTITGKIIDTDNKPIENAEVLLLTKDSIALKSELTDLIGNFTLNEKKGNYLLQVRQIGKTLYHKVLKLDKNTDLGIIKVASFQGLQEVTITSKKKLLERKVDRLVFNVENYISATGGDVIDVLKITPGLRVQNDAISMIGKSGMAVMVDDRLMQLSGDDLISFLKSIQSDNIKSIEVITNPPAKYSAEGNSGLVNIKLKKVKLDSWSASINTAYRQATYSIGSVGGSFNYQKNKVSLVISTNYSNGAYQGIEKSKIYYPSLLWDSEGKGKYFTNFLSNRAGLDYQITKKWSMGVQYIGSFSKPNIDDTNIANLINNITNANNGLVQTFGNSIKKGNFNSLNWHTNLALDTLGRNISIDFDYLNYKSDNNRNFYSTTSNSTQTEVPNGYLSANNLTNQKIDNYSTQINMEYPLKWVNLSYGTKLSFSVTNNDVNYYNTTNGIPIYDPSQSNLFEYKENTQALYFSGNKKFGNNKWEIQSGLRIENTQTEGVSTTLNQTTTNNIIQFFPTVYLSYAQNENHNFSLNYGKRIYRPGFRELNPFRWYTSPYSYSEGNPDLKPTYTHNIEFNHSFKNHLYTSLTYSQDIDNSGQVVLLSGSDYFQKVTRLNYFNNYSLAWQQVYIFKKLNWLESQNAFFIYFQHSKSKIYPITPKTGKGFGSTITTSNTFKLNKDKTILSGFDIQYNFPNQSPDLVHNNESMKLNIFLRMLFMKKNLQISITGNNLLKAYDFNNTSKRNNIEASYNGYYDSRYLRLSLSYKFGSSKINVNQRKISNEEEKSRTN